MKKTILFSLSIFLIISCFKNQEQTTTVSGIVIDYGSKEPIVDVLVSIRDGPGGNDPLTGEPLGTDENSRTTTDKDGKFSVSITGEWGPMLSIHHPEYWNYRYIAPGGGWSAGSKAYDGGSINENEIFKLHAFAWYSALIVPTMFTETAKFWILNEQWTPAGGRSTRWEENGPFDYSDPDSPAMFYGNDYLRRKIDYKRDGHWHEYRDSIYIKKDQILHDTIYF